MLLSILKWNNRLEKMHRICTEFTKVVRRCFSILMQNSDNPKYEYSGQCLWC